MEGLYELLLRDPRFSPRLVVFPYRLLNDTPVLEDYERNLKFFRRIDSSAVGMLLKNGWSKSMRALRREFAADIVFYQQPWIQDQNLWEASRWSWNVYTHYAYTVNYAPKIQYFKDNFHEFLHIYFCQSETHRRIHIEARPEHADKLDVAGYPKFDGVRKTFSPLLKKSDDGQTRLVIYAPHHSIGRNNSFRLSTFDWNRLEIFALAKAHKEINWIYRPHPTLKYAVENCGLMSTSDYMRYESQWTNLPNARVSHGGNYMEMFFSSHALITDCGSFLGEYMLTGRPLIRLISRNDPVKPNEVGERIDAACYRVHSIEELEAVFQQVVIHGDDPLRDRRLELRDALFPLEQDSAQEIVNALLRRFRNGS